MSFTTILPDEGEWESGFQPERKGGLIWYMKWSKPSSITGASV